LPPIRYKPDYAKAYCNFGAAYAETGRYSKAVSAFEEAIRLNPDDTTAHQNLKRAYEKIKDRKKAWENSFFTAKIFHLRKS
jgi:tetratricopeptide (TPR) repeat protein